MEESKLYGLLCFITALFVSGLSMVPTLYLWRGKDLGRTDLPDTIIARLIGNACLFAFGYIEKVPEDMWLNGPCAVFQIINLATYAVLCSKLQRRRVRKLLLGGMAYLVLTLAVGLSRESVVLFKACCTISGLVAAVAPFVTAVFTINVRKKTTDLLPRSCISVMICINGLLWVLKGVMLPDTSMVLQNAAAAFCSALLFLLQFVWDEAEKYYPPLRAVQMDEQKSTSTGGKELMEGAGSEKDKDKDKDKDSEKTQDPLGKSSASVSASGHKVAAVDGKTEAGGNGGLVVKEDHPPAPAEQEATPPASEAVIPPPVPANME